MSRYHRKNTLMRKVYRRLNFISFLLFFSQKDTNPTLWESILTLRDHNADRRQADPNLWRESQEAKVVAFVVNVCKMVVGFPTKEKAQDLVHCVMGILATNSANLDLPSEGFGSGYALYPTYAKVNHSCYSNTKNLNHLPQHQ